MNRLIADKYTHTPICIYKHYDSLPTNGEIYLEFESTDRLFGSLEPVFDESLIGLTTYRKPGSKCKIYYCYHSIYDFKEGYYYVNAKDICVIHQK